MFESNRPSGSSGSSSPTEERGTRTLRNTWMIFGGVVVLLLGYIGFVFWSRSQDAQLAARNRAERAAAAQKEADEKSVESLGGSDFKILAFYASPGLLHRGDSATMCYGVSNAKTVKLDPPEANVWPAATRCVQVTPKKTTKYTFTADDGSGNTKTAELTLTVQ